MDLVYLSVGRYVEKNDELVGGGVELVCLGVGRYVKKNDELVCVAWKNVGGLGVENNVRDMVCNEKNWDKAERGFYTFSL